MGLLAMKSIPSRRILVGNSAPPESDKQIISSVVPICKDRKHQPAGIDGPQIHLISLEMSSHVGLILVRNQAPWWHKVKWLFPHWAASLQPILTESKSSGPGLYDGAMDA